ncbi:hypothetical protein GIB67_041797 [Kingdonia uniflora]|uniref:Uncharacterized protein n=1 Tax=Kingdonia uniflora TaxID=39325 RepID=A0A7J7L5T7_9MAGN|nr:hypothetical protein GIB67_041797 [Kingdonia uniflora]
METLAEECQEDNNMTIKFPCLQILRLKRLPKLSSLPHVLLQCPSLEELQIWNFLNLKRLPFGLQSTLKLKKFEIDYDEWFERLQWDDLSVKLQLQHVLTPREPKKKGMEKMPIKEEKNEEVDWLKDHAEVIFPRLNAYRNVCFSDIIFCYKNSDLPKYRVTLTVNWFQLILLDLCYVQLSQTVMQVRRLLYESSKF